MPDLDSAITQLKSTLGDFLARDRTGGVFHIQVGGAGSVPGLSDLAAPELHLDYLGDLGPEQRRALTALGYHEQAGTWRHPGGWTLLLADEGSGWRAGQQALRALLLADAEARAEYRAAYEAGGQVAADGALWASALAHHAQSVGFGPARWVAERLCGLTVPWMFAAGAALDMHLGRITRPHDDLDIVVPREAQAEVCAALANWRLDACVGGTYAALSGPLEPPDFQIHARHPDLTGVPMLDIMLTDLSGDVWHYRRDPSITLPLAEARRIGPHGLPYLAPQAVLLFKAGTPGRPPQSQRRGRFRAGRIHPDGRRKRLAAFGTEHSEPRARLAGTAVIGGIMAG